jgi:hypothetical protein
MRAAQPLELLLLVRLRPMVAPHIVETICNRMDFQQHLNNLLTSTVEYFRQNGSCKVHR